MLTVREAARIGIDACIDKIGREFVLAHRGSGTSSYGENEEENCVYCYVGVSDKPYVSGHPGILVLDSESKFPYYASCNVSLADGTMTFIDCALPA